MLVLLLLLALLLEDLHARLKALHAAPGCSSACSSLACGLLVAPLFARYCVTVDAARPDGEAASDFAAADRHRDSVDGDSLAGSVSTSDSLATSFRWLLRSASLIAASGVPVMCASRTSSQCNVTEE
ncbi:hypothetical protein [Paraburkholderia diazotrophica]|uniref:hypothetical protein n=1 Tax=Paraburkholderia diazotrophica TaxID=667676 RepID=UPI0015A500A9|nr:hypothetical protein [Paraburkholderia diazotrophica]